jgi:hypothetical protein
VNNFLKHTLLGVPISTWILQVLYVAVALLILLAFVSAHKRSTIDMALFIGGIIIIDVIWRLAIK